jgi:probable DNA metabolism protein
MAARYGYDGSIAGLLTVIGLVLAEGAPPEQVSVGVPAQGGLFDEVRRVATDEEAAAGAWEGLTRLLAPAELGQVRLALLADRPGWELLICRYCLLVQERGRGSGSMLAHPDVAPLRRLARQVAREAHRWLGFVRFRQLRDGCYYAAVAPEHRILPLVADHFADRFRDQQWVIHDVRRGEGLLHDAGRRQWRLLPLELTGDPEETREEERFRALWRRYFATLAIEERRNSKLQQSKVPLKVRPWLTEFGGTDNGG